MQRLRAEALVELLDADASARRQRAPLGDAGPGGLHRLGIQRLA